MEAETLHRKKCTRLLQRMQGGDPTALPALRRLLNESPEQWNALGNMAMQAWHAWADLAAGNNEVIREAVWRWMEALTLELSGPSPTNLERLRITRVVLCGVQVHYADMMCAQTTKVTVQRAEYFQRRQDCAHRRYLSAIRSLAAVRRLQLPTAVQVNIGGQHVNVLDTAAEPVSKNR